MKTMRKLSCLLLALALLLSLGAVTAFAQDVGTAADGTATITIKNAAKGETYSVYKLFDATVTGTADGSIAYTGTIPDSLSSYFTKDAVGSNISVAENVKETELFAALKTWAKTATATATAKSDGSVLQFVGLSYGYYVVTTTQGDTAITVTSTNPDATIYDKNTTVPGPDPNVDVKKVDNDNVSVGDTVTYTVTFKTTNFNGSGENAKRIVSYTITDTLPGFLKDVTVTSIKIGNDDYKVNDDTPQFNNKEITIPWVSGDATNGYTSLYNNGAVVTITYTATVTDKVAIDGEGNKNEVTISWTDEGGNTPGDTDKITGTDTIYSYAIAVKKVDDKGAALAGATFQFPFYVKETADTNGAYIYAGTTAGTGLTNTITTPASGEIVVKGVATGTYSITETAAPAGYNKLDGNIEVTAVQTGKTTTNTTTYLDADGNISATETETVVTYTNNNLAATAVFVVNKAGSTLPSTGGMGTTLFYILGGILVVGAGVLLVTKRRMKNEA